MFIAFAIIDIGYAVPLDVKNLTFALVLSQAVELTIIFASLVSLSS